MSNTKKYKSWMKKKYIGQTKQNTFNKRAIVDAKPKKRHRATKQNTFKKRAIVDVNPKSTT
jgi:hypothetical protein